MFNLFSCYFTKKKKTHKGDGINHPENDYLIKMLDN